MNARRVAAVTGAQLHGGDQRIGAIGDHGFEQHGLGGEESIERFGGDARRPRQGVGAGPGKAVGGERVPCSLDDDGARLLVAALLRPAAAARLFRGAAGLFLSHLRDRHAFR